MHRTDSLKRDTYFKHIVSGEDEASIYIRNLIIESILGITFNHLYAINPEMVPDYDKEKDMILDILFVADTGEYIQMEMQDSKLTEKQLKRFQANGSRLVVNQLKKGDSYNDLKRVYQLIFISDAGNHRLTSYFTFKDEDGIEEKETLVTRVYIFIQYIETVLRRKAIEQLTEFECLIYLFNYSLTYAILKVDKKVVRYMEQKADAYFKELKQLTYQWAREDGKRMMKTALEDAETAKQDAECAKKELIDKTQELEAKSQERSILSLTVLMEQLGVSLNEAYNMLNIPQHERAILDQKILNR